jgi:hypothetical protein
VRLQKRESRSPLCRFKFEERQVESSRYVSLQEHHYILLIDTDRGKSHNFCTVGTGEQMDFIQETKGFIQGEKKRKKTFINMNHENKKRGPIIMLIEQCDNKFSIYIHI